MVPPTTSGSSRRVALVGRGLHGAVGVDVTAHQLGLDEDPAVGDRVVRVETWIAGTASTWPIGGQPGRRRTSC